MLTFIIPSSLFLFLFYVSDRMDERHLSDRITVIVGVYQIKSIGIRIRAVRAIWVY